MLIPVVTLNFAKFHKILFSERLLSYPFLCQIKENIRLMENKCSFHMLTLIYYINIIPIAEFT